MSAAKGHSKRVFVVLQEHLFWNSKKINPAQKNEHNSTQTEQRAEKERERERKGNRSLAPWCPSKRKSTIYTRLKKKCALIIVTGFAHQSASIAGYQSYSRTTGERGCLAMLTNDNIFGLSCRPKRCQIHARKGVIGGHTFSAQGPSAVG